MGFGWGQLRARADGSYDLFIRQGTLSEDLNLIKLDLVQEALMAALDLANGIKEDESLVSTETAQAAEELMKLVTRSAST